MAAKSDAPPAKDAAKDAAAKDASPAGDAAAKPAAKPMAALLPVVAVVILAPVLSFAVGQFVLIPQLKKQIAAMPAEEEHHAEASPAPAKESGGHGKKGEPAAAAGPSNTYEMKDVVVNLAGTMGTRYLKSSFIVTGADKNLRATFEENKPKLVDITLNVLSSLSLADLEEAGAKNIIREKLIIAYNQALGRKVAEQVYFIDFVVQ